MMPASTEACGPCQPCPFRVHLWPDSDVPRGDRDVVSVAWRATGPRIMMEIPKESGLVAWAPSTKELSGGLLEEGGRPS